MRALCLLREALVYRRTAFCDGLRSAGYDVVGAIADPGPHDVVCVWNRHGSQHVVATRFEEAGARVIVAENGHLGKDWNGATWFALALGHHAGAGQWVCGGPERWDALGVRMGPWRAVSSQLEPLILAQRGIGEPGIRSPEGWAEAVQKRIGGRIRRHPGKDGGVSLEQDLDHADCVVTWSSGAALKALLLGVPVWYDFAQWIGAGAARPLREWGAEPKRDDGRLACFRRLAWSMWTLTEIESGVAFAHLLA